MRLILIVSAQRLGNKLNNKTPHVPVPSGATRRRRYLIARRYRQNVGLARQLQISVAK